MDTELAKMIDVLYKHEFPDTKKLNDEEIIDMYVKKCQFVDKIKPLPMTKNDCGTEGLNNYTTKYYNLIIISRYYAMKIFEEMMLLPEHIQSAINEKYIIK